MWEIKYKTIFNSILLKAIESLLDPELLKYHSVSDIILMTDRKRWIIELKPDAQKRAKAKK